MDLQSPETFHLRNNYSVRFCFFIKLFIQLIEKTYSNILNTFEADLSNSIRNLGVLHQKIQNLNKIAI